MTRKKMTKAEIAEERAAGWTREELAQFGVPWGEYGPPKDWQRKLLAGLYRKPDDDADPMDC